MKKDILVKFFKDYSQNVDNADGLGFWYLSDKIIENIIQTHLDALYTGTELTILDAGCGTGRWIQKIIKNNPNKKLTFIAYDLYESMLNKAKSNLVGIQNIKFIEGDMEDMSQIKEDTIDFCISIYSPISFLDNPESFIRELQRILKPSGRAIIMGHAYHNAIDSKINNYIANADELKNLYENKMVQWNSSLPVLHTFAIEDFEQYGRNVGLSCIGGYGVPIYIKPQGADWDPENLQKGEISLKLENDSAFFDQIFNMEIANNSKKELINRGMNIIAYFKK